MTPKITDPIKNLALEGKRLHRNNPRTTPEMDALAHVAWSLARLRGVAAQAEIEAASGPAIPTITAAERMHRSTQSVRNLIKEDALIAFRPIADATKYLLPIWQFPTRDAVYPWVPDLITAHGTNGMGLLNFVTVPRSNLGGGHYLHLLLTGRWEIVINAARRGNPD